jgi:hypothetical protein
MRQELTQDLRNKYPKILQYVNRFECRDGWYHILNFTLFSIQDYIDSSGVPQVEATQIKEKFGSLNFYYFGGDENVKFLVSSAKKFSLEVCEVCGEDGALINDGWMKVRCDEHRGS